MVEGGSLLQILEPKEDRQVSAQPGAGCQSARRLRRATILAVAWSGILEPKQDENIIYTGVGGRRGFAISSDEKQVSWAGLIE